MLKILLGPGCGVSCPPAQPPPVTSLVPHELLCVHGHFQVERSWCWSSCCALGSCLEREGEAAGKQVIPRRRQQANVTLSGLVSSFSTVPELSKPLQSEGSQQAWMKPFLGPAAPQEGCGAPNSCSLEPETSAPALAAHISSGPSQDTSGERCNCSRLGSIARVTPEHDACGCASSSPAPRILGAALPRAVSRGLGVGAPERPQPFSSSALLSPSPPRFSFLRSSRFPGAEGTETPAALCSDPVCPARPFPSRTLTHISVWNPEQCPHLPLATPSHTTPAWA